MRRWVELGSGGRRWRGRNNVVVMLTKEREGYGEGERGRQGERERVKELSYGKVTNFEGN